MRGLIIGVAAAAAAFATTASAAQTSASFLLKPGTQEFDLASVLLVPDKHYHVTLLLDVPAPSNQTGGAFAPPKQTIDSFNAATNTYFLTTTIGETKIFGSPLSTTVDLFPAVPGLEEVLQVPVPLHSFTQQTSSNYSKTLCQYGPAFTCYGRNTYVTTTLSYYGEGRFTTSLDADQVDAINATGKLKVNANLPRGVVGQLTVSLPEPGTWALMVLGFGSVGAALRRRQRLGAMAA